MQPVPDKPEAAKADDARTREELLVEVEYLRTEVAYLKKLDALVRSQKQSATLRKKRKQEHVEEGQLPRHAAMESFFAVLKTELFYLKKFSSIAELETAIGEYIRYYNYERIKMKLKDLSPVQYRTQAMAA